MKHMKTKAPYESPAIESILFETENILDQSSGGTGGFFGEEDTFYQSNPVKIEIFE